MSGDKMPPACPPDPFKPNRPTYADLCPQSPQSSQSPHNPHVPQYRQNNAFTKECLKSMKPHRRPLSNCPCEGISSPRTIRGRPLSVPAEVARDKRIAAEKERLPLHTSCDKYRSNSAEGRPFDPCTFSSYAPPNSPVPLQGRPLNIEMEVERARRIAMNQRNPPPMYYRSQSQFFDQRGNLTSDSSPFGTLSNGQTQHTQQGYGPTSGLRERAVGRITPRPNHQLSGAMADNDVVRTSQWATRSLNSSPVRQSYGPSFVNSTLLPPGVAGTPSRTITRTRVTTTTKSTPHHSPRYPPNDTLLEQRQQQSAPMDADISRQQKTYIPVSMGTQTKIPPQSMFSSPPQSSQATSYHGMESQTSTQVTTECVETQTQPSVESTSASAGLTDNLTFNSKSDTTSPRQNTTSMQPGSPLTSSRQPQELAPLKQVPPDSNTIPDATAQVSSQEGATDKNVLKTETEMPKRNMALKQPSEQFLSPQGSPMVGQRMDLGYETFASGFQGPMGFGQSTHIGGTECDQQQTAKSASTVADVSHSQQVSVCQPCPPQDMSFSALLRYLGDRLRSTFDYLSSFVKPQSSLGTTSSIIRETSPSGSTSQLRSWQPNQSIGGPWSRPLHHGTLTSGASPIILDMRNRISQSICPSNDDYGSRQFPSTSQKTNVGSQSARECAEAKRCGRISLDSSDKHEAQRTSQFTLIRKAQIENLVLDTYCPGIIQETVDGIEDFNETSFNLSYQQVDECGCNDGELAEPMSLLEAFALRIDYDRQELDKKIPENATEPEIADIVNTHYTTMNPSELNRSIKGFLLSERTIELEQMNSDQASPFNADVERKSFDIVLYDSPFKLVTYIGKTKVASE